MNDDDKDKIEVREFMAKTSTELHYIRQEMGEVRRILETQSELEKRLIRIEEQRVSNHDAMLRIHRRLDAHESELEKWRTARRVLGWGFAVALVIIAAFAQRMMQ